MLLPTAPGMAENGPRPARRRDRFFARRQSWRLLVLLALGAGGGHTLHAQSPGPVKPEIDFNREIRPVLAENCLKCHGPDDLERKGKLRLDVRGEALKPAKSGERAIVPGAPEKSELVRRVASQDPDDRMPPAKSGKPLTDAQVNLLRRWIAEGAPFAKHWAYAKPVRPALPAVQNPRWPRNAVDQFLLARMEREGWQPSPEADRPTLARRVALDLTGLPPTVQEVEEFVRDNRLDAYEALVDRLLQKPAFGEHWARLWLDLARYADSTGYADDTARTIWAFRDYVIKAFNANKPFDRFTIEQLAGDLLPDATEEDVVATAFHRNTMTNNEGGTDDEEFRNAAVIDRVNTTMAVWMGTSMGCAQCHNHKYDPISQKEYFSFFAILNNTADADRNDESPVLKIFSAGEKEQRSRLEGEIAALEKKLRTVTPELATGQEKWEKAFPRQLEWTSLNPAVLAAKNGATLTVRETGRIRATGGGATDVYTLEIPLRENQLTGLRLETVPDATLPNQGPGTATNGGFVISRIAATLQAPATSRTTGRYVRVELPGKDKFLSLAEVQVFSGQTNVARQGEATQSSTDFDGPARLAIDGNTDGHFAEAKSTTHTAQSDNPWWEVDLKQAQSIDRIAIWNRLEEGVKSRLSGFRVLVLDEKHEPVWERQVEETPDPSVELSLDGKRAIHFAAVTADATDPGRDAKSVIGEKANNRKGWSAGAGDGQSHYLTLLVEKPVAIAPGSRLILTIEQKAGAERGTLASFRLAMAQDERLADLVRLPAAITGVLKLGTEERSAAQREELAQYYLAEVAPELRADRERVTGLKSQLAGLPGTTVPVMRELTGDARRKTRVQMRGNFRNLGDEVPAALPTAFHPPPPGGTPDRLALARWLVDENNPLTSRVLANRFWEQIFGIGLVRTSEDFGTQGERPTHPELLDWLATELLRQHWDIKAFLKTLVTSAAYRQSSRLTPEMQERDPENLFLERGPRVRLPAEVVRDQALAVSGLLSGKMFGASVRPPQPSSGLSAAFGSSLDWKTSEGEDRYRRGLYIEWRRTRPYPSLATFDAPNREVCMIRRPRSNTPLQALVTLNDPVFIEAARALGGRMAQFPGTIAEKAQHGFRRCVARPPSEGELKQLVTFFNEARTVYAADPMQAKQLATDAVAPMPTGVELADLAAWTTLGNVLLNLDETLMRR